MISNNKVLPITGSNDSHVEEKSLEKLIDILSNESLLSHEKIKEFKILIIENIERKLIPFDSQIISIIKAHGWDGSKFNQSWIDDTSLVRLLRHELSNLYLKKLTHIEFVQSYDNEISQLLSFCPDTIYNLIAENKLSEKLVPSKFYFDGICMIADISGFTKLSGDLCDQGVSGLDKLHLHISQYIGEIINIVYYHKGDGNTFFTYNTMIILKLS